MPARLNRILSLEVPIIVQLGQRLMPLGDVISLIPGAIIELPKGASEELELLVNNKVIGQGTAVKVGENFGLRVAHIGDAKNRIEALGGATAATAPAAEPLPPEAPAAPVAESPAAQA
jgi:flagellar motor switch protein FliN